MEPRESLVLRKLDVVPGGKLEMVDKASRGVGQVGVDAEIK